MKKRVKSEISQNEDVLAALEAEIRKQGFAGSADIPKIVFLTAITRKFSNPVSLVVMGPSGAGKTHAIETGLQFIPPEEICSLSGMSEKALPYLKDLSLKNRVLYLGEAAGMDDGNGRTFLRQLLTEGKVDYVTVQKTANGLEGKKLPTVEGPVSFMMATTANKIHHEDQSRMLVLNVNEDPQRIREGLLNAALGRTKKEISIDTNRWHEFVKEISEIEIDITIPFAAKLVEGIEINNLKIQRDFPKLLSIIKACALVHMNFREADDKGRIMANKKDYEIAYELLNGPISEGLEQSVRSSIRELVEAITEMSKNESKYLSSFSQSQIAEYMKKDRTTVGRNIHAAVNEGYLINENPGQGKEAKVRLGDRKISNKGALPSPDSLFDLIPTPDSFLKCDHIPF